MVVDSSSLIAILFSEPEAESFYACIARDEVKIASVATILETTIAAVRKKGDHMVENVDALVSSLDLEIVAMDLRQMHMARKAFLRFGKGRHAAQLNFGDCISYALAKTTDEPLLFKGTDFGHTDIALVDLST
jgi:ribonuclease VapC